MSLLRMDNVSIVVEDLPGAIAFFAELGLELEGQASVEGPAVNGMVGLEGVHSDIAMMRMPDGHGRLELTRFRSPRAVPGAAREANTLGISRIMFAVSDIDDVLARLQRLGARLVGRVEQYEDSYRICYIRGPEGILLALAESLGDTP